MTLPLSGHGDASRRALATSAEPVLFLDLDGTLAPLVHLKRRAKVPVRTERLLLRLRRSGVLVVIVSGRGIPGVHSVLDAKVDGIIGNHGADLYVGRTYRRHLPGDPRILRRAVRRLESLNEWRNVMVQAKPLSIAVHWRGPPALGLRVWNEVQRLIGGWHLEMHTGRRVIDIRLPGVDKGEAVLAWLRVRSPQALRRRSVCYAGDDTTDEYAFRALAGRGVTIAVGPRAKGAQFRTSGVASFARWLERLARERGGQD